MWVSWRSVSRSLRRQAFPISIGFLSLSILMGCSNIMREYAEKDYDKAILYDAKQDILNGDYEDAIDRITNDLSDDYQDRRDVKFLLAQAYSGACGLDALDMLTTIASGATNFFPILLTAMVDATATERAFCDSALTTIHDIDIAADRTPSENFFALFAAFGKLGAYLAVSADADDNGTNDVGWEPCDNGDLPSAQVDQAVAAFGTAMTSLTQLVADDVDLGTSEITDISALCTLISAVDASYDICSQVDPTTVTARQRVALRCLFDGPDLGFTIQHANIAVCLDHAGNAACPGP